MVLREWKWMWTMGWIASQRRRSSRLVFWGTRLCVLGHEVTSLVLGQLQWGLGMICGLRGKRQGSGPPSSAASHPTVYSPAAKSGTWGPPSKSASLPFASFLFSNAIFNHFIQMPLPQVGICRRPAARQPCHSGSGTPVRSSTKNGFMLLCYLLNLSTLTLMK